VILDFSTRVSVSGLKACGAALYIRGMLMDVVLLDPELMDQPIPFWDGAPIHCKMITPGNPNIPAVVIRLYSSAKDLTKHKMSFIQAEQTIEPDGEHPYMLKVVAAGYKTAPQQLGLCYTPDGDVKFVLPKYAPDVPGFVTRDPTL